MLVVADSSRLRVLIVAGRHGRIAVRVRVLRLQFAKKYSFRQISDVSL